MKRLMVMGAAIEQVPGIRKAKEMGYEVAVIDYNPTAVGILLADKYYNVSTTDREGVLEAAKDFHADGFLTLATDLPMRAVAYACEKLGLNCISQRTALLATDKGEMIKSLKEHNVSIPWYVIINSYEELKKQGKSFTYPCIMKPIDNAASRGVALVDRYERLLDTYEYTKSQSHNGQIIVEEYMQGPEVSVEVLSYNGFPHVLQITDKITTGSPHFVELGHNQPSQLNQVTREMISSLACLAVEAIGIIDGPAHVEIIVTEQGPKIVELGARLGGDCIASHLVYLSTGIDMIKETIKVLCGEIPNLEKKYDKGASVRFLTSKTKGIFEDIASEEQVRTTNGVIEVARIMQPGDVVDNIRSSDDRAAYVVTQGNNVRMSSEIADKAIMQMKIVLSSNKLTGSVTKKS